MLVCLLSSAQACYGKLSVDLKYSKTYSISDGNVSVSSNIETFSSYSIR